MTFHFHSLLALVLALALGSLVACQLESESESEETDTSEEAVTYGSAHPTATTSSSAKPPKDPCADKDAECIDKGTENKLCGTHVSKQQCDDDSDCSWCPAKTK